MRTGGRLASAPSDPGSLARVSILGSPLRRTEDPRLLTVGGTYTADVDDPLLASPAHVTFVRSTMAHGRILAVDTSEAERAPGVIGVFTARELDRVGGLGRVPALPPMFPAEMGRPWLAGEVVRFVGEPVAAIVTEEQSQGVDAAEQVGVELDPLPVVVDPSLSVTDEELVFPDVGTNIALALGDDAFDDQLFDGCEVVVTQRIHHPRLASCALEGRSVAVAWSGDCLTMWLSSQNAHAVREVLAATYGMDAGQVRVVVPDVGGGFGPKINPHPEELLVPWLSRQVGRPLRWSESRTENMISMGHGRGQVHDVTIGGSRDGRIEALRVDIVADAGAYPALGAFLPYFTRKMASGVYAIPRVETRSRSVLTNKISTVAYRGAGRPEATEAIERAVDCFAAEIGLDPVEVRRRNFVPADSFPYRTAAGSTYDSGEYEQALDLVVAAADLEGLRQEQARRRRAGGRLQLGIGISTYVEITAGPNPGQEYAEVRMSSDGRVSVLTGTSPHGQGHHTAWAMVASEVLGTPVELVEVIHGDTAEVPRGGGTMGSRSAQLGGAAVHEAATQLLERARATAADLLGVSVEHLVLDRARGVFHPAGAPSECKSWSEVVGAGSDGAMVAEADFRAPTTTFPFGAHLAVVEVDTETGAVRLERFVSCDDAGRILNPLLAEGQRHGGIAQGVAQALLEEVRYDTDGNPLTTNLADYAMISAPELPLFELETLETPAEANPLGAKGIGESGTIGATPAVHNAVIDALAPFGVRHIDLPLTPEKVWRAIRGGALADQEEIS